MKMSKSSADVPLVVAASQITNATIQGFLEKKRPTKKLLSVKYQKRWCVIYGNYFFYYNSPDDKEQNGCFSLEGYRFLSCPGNGPFGFSLINKHKRLYEFMASSHEEYIKWKEAIKKGILLTQRYIEPIRVQKEHTYGKTELKQNTEGFKKCTSLPNLNAAKRQQFADNSFHNTIDIVNVKERPVVSVKNTQWSQITYNTESRNQTSHKGQSSDKVHSTDEENEETDDECDDDDDDDGSGYVHTGKLNCPKMDRTVDSSNTPHCKNYTEDDYMTVISDSGCRQDEDPYAAVNNKNNHSKEGIEKLYSSVKRPEANIKLCQNDECDSSGYVHAAKLNLPKMNRIPNASHTSEDKTYTEDDYMTVLSSDTGNSLGEKSSDDPYTTVDSENHKTKQGIEKLYSSVKRQETSILFCDESNPYAELSTVEHHETRHEAIYSSVERSKRDKYSLGTGYVPVDEQSDNFSNGSSSDSEDDYVEANEIRSFSKVAKHNLDQILARLSSGDYDRVDAILPSKKLNDKSPCTSSESGTDDDDYELLPENISHNTHSQTACDTKPTQIQHNSSDEQCDPEVWSSSSEEDISSLTIESNPSPHNEPIYENLHII